MKIITSHIMQIKLSTTTPQPHYNIILSRANLEHLLFDYSYSNRLVGCTQDGTTFYLGGNPYGKMPNSFHPLHKANNYIAYVGIHIPRIPLDITSQEFIRVIKKTYHNLKTKINESDKIPIKRKSKSGESNLGYAIISVEDSKPSNEL